jgi:outer membrane protein OmpA-like peptidoglycan-associated protein
MRLIMLALAGLVLMPHEPAIAQSDAATRALIQQLSRLPNTERGIRLPAPAPAPATSEAAPDAARRAAPAVAEVRRSTTAPADIPAVSITITFPSGSADLTPSAEAALLPLGRALNSADLGADRFRIEGHTDRVGSRELNQTLSERRAAAVRDFLVRRYQVDMARIEVVGRGEDDPLIPTADEVAAAANRRVQVLNLGR